MVLDSTETIADNQPPISGLISRTTLLIKCNFCQRPDLSVSPDTSGTVKFKCKGCRQWNIYEVARETPSLQGKSRLRYIGGAQR